jgi:nucleotide-binding universal stress UspA family protein
MKKVLITLDYEPSATKVAEEGYAIAQALQAQTILLHVIADAGYYAASEYSPIMGFTGFVNLDIDNFMDGLKGEAQRFLEESKKHLGDERVQTGIVEGDFAESILSFAKEHAADMIVMGTHGRRGINKLLMGNLAEKVLHDTHIPVLVIPTKDDVENK